MLRPSFGVTIAYTEFKQFFILIHDCLLCTQRMLFSKKWRLNRIGCRACAKIVNIPYESLRAFKTFKTRPVPTFRRNFSMAILMTSEFRSGPMKCAKEPLRSPIEATRSMPIRSRPSIPRRERRRAVDAEPRGMLIARATTFCSFLSTSRFHGRSRRRLYVSVDPVFLYDGEAGRPYIPYRHVGVLVQCCVFFPFRESLGLLFGV